jgi:hypothetical protein
MTYPIQVALSINESDLGSTSVSPLYPLGKEIVIKDSAYGNAVKKFMYVKAHTNLTQYQPYTVVFSNVSGSEVITAAPATLASGVTVCVPKVAIASAYYGWVQIFGDCTVKLAAETHVAGDYLELLNAGTTFMVDGSSGSTVYSVKSVAKQIGTLSGAGTARAFLFGGVRTSLVSAT